MLGLIGLIGFNCRGLIYLFKNLNCFKSLVISYFMIYSILLFLLVILTLIILVGRLWIHLSNFYHKRYSFFDLAFILIYFTEQFIFLLLYNLIEEYRALWVSLIVLIVVTTASLDKLMMISRHKRSREVIFRSILEQNNLLNMIKGREKENDFLKNENQTLIKYIQKRLEKK